ncbi:hypothetical protein FACS1894125_2840 [Actinomycetota bacterium]|nr:hypothetical protein FACS1894125_2840 [Actinomycetota bacterium]
MEKEYGYLIFCIETYRHDRKIPGSKVFAMFNEFGVSKFILKHYDTLHSQSDDFVLGDIDDMLRSRGAIGATNA